eukprot:gene14372-biopygen2332
MGDEATDVFRCRDGRLQRRLALPHALRESPSERDLQHEVQGSVNCVHDDHSRAEEEPRDSRSRYHLTEHRPRVDHERDVEQEHVQAPELDGGVVVFPQRVRPHHARGVESEEGGGEEGGRSFAHNHRQLPPEQGRGGNAGARRRRGHWDIPCPPYL